MKVLVFIKRTPDTAAVVKPTPDGKDIVREGLAFIINPYDEFAVQEAVNVKSAKGGETVVMTVGDDASTEQLRRALAMGIDRAILVKHDRFWELNPSQIGYAIAEIAKRENPDLIILGKVTIDDYTYALAPYVAQALGYNLVTYATNIEYGDSTMKVERESDLGKEIWEVYTYEIVKFTPPPPRKGVKLLESVDDLIRVLKEEVKIL